MFTADIHSGVGFIPISSSYQFIFSFHYSLHLGGADHDLVRTLKAGGSNGENGGIRDEGRYHHGTKDTNFGFWGFGDIIFPFALFRISLF